MKRPSLLTITPLAIMTLLCALLNSGCSVSTTGVETTNGYTVTATAVAISGKAPAASQVYLCDTSYIPFINSGIGHQTAPNLSGIFDFSTHPGRYNLVILATNGTSGMISMSIPPNDTAKSIRYTLNEPGSISGTITGTAQPLLVYLAGTSYYRHVASKRTFTFHEVPTGTHRIRIITLPTDQTKPVLILYDEEVQLITAHPLSLGTITLSN